MKAAADAEGDGWTMRGGQTKNRRQFKLETKLAAIEHAKRVSIHAASRLFNVDRVSVRKWMQREEDLREQQFELRSVARRFIPEDLASVSPEPMEMNGDVADLFVGADGEAEKPADDASGSTAANGAEWSTNGDVNPAALPALLNDFYSSFLPAPTANGQKKRGRPPRGSERRDSDPEFALHGSDATSSSSESGGDDALDDEPGGAPKHRKEIALNRRYTTKVKPRIPVNVLNGGERRPRGRPRKSLRLPPTIPAAPTPAATPSATARPHGGQAVLTGGPKRHPFDAITDAIRSIPSTVAQPRAPPNGELPSTIVMQLKHPMATHTNATMASALASTSASTATSTSTAAPRHRMSIAEKQGRTNFAHLMDAERGASTTTGERRSSLGGRDEMTIGDFLKAKVAAKGPDAFPPPPFAPPPPVKRKRGRPPKIRPQPDELQFVMNLWNAAAQEKPKEAERDELAALFDSARTISEHQRAVAETTGESSSQTPPPCLSPEVVPLPSANSDGRSFHADVGEIKPLDLSAFIPTNTEKTVEQPNAVEDHRPVVANITNVVPLDLGALIGGSNAEDEGKQTGSNPASTSASTFTLVSVTSSSALENFWNARASSSANPSVRPKPPAILHRPRLQFACRSSPQPSTSREENDDESEDANVDVGPPPLFPQSDAEIAASIRSYVASLLPPRPLKKRSQSEIDAKIRSILRQAGSPANVACGPPPSRSTAPLLPQTIGLAEFQQQQADAHAAAGIQRRLGSGFVVLADPRSENFVSVPTEKLKGSRRRETTNRNRRRPHAIRAAPIFTPPLVNAAGQLVQTDGQPVEPRRKRGRPRKYPRPEEEAAVIPVPGSFDESTETSAKPPKLKRADVRDVPFVQTLTNKRRLEEHAENLLYTTLDAARGFTRDHFVSTGGLTERSASQPPPFVAVVAKLPPQRRRYERFRPTRSESVPPEGDAKERMVKRAQQFVSRLKHRYKRKSSRPKRAKTNWEVTANGHSNSLDSSLSSRLDSTSSTEAPPFDGSQLLANFDQLFRPQRSNGEVEAMNAVALAALVGFSPSRRSSAASLDVQREAPKAPVQPAAAAVHVPRKRGRPRKYPRPEEAVVPAVGANGSAMKVGEPKEAANATMPTERPKRLADSAPQAIIELSDDDEEEAEAPPPQPPPAKRPRGRPRKDAPPIARPAAPQPC
ncbi:hypothetical protein M3Y99_00219500 [Aphelenchoides fujianensis]|nr:hypothetical protein M3Y99_00219500 [Aphelenchoides fujianensis]